ncbi:PP2C family protein-serine/threonine phosphatase [Ornithinimicrobium flavum]|uniref:PP2C family protein-serine/threonine phosphatase n=1 Tax=Ornithinimicrobium flavum TaxID=1288636 RepID=UPI00106F8723|nr:protein phosphatase 2C domain-containing protein [Ornithinimicrobium flavum]
MPTFVAFRYAARTNVGLGSKSRNEDSAYAGPELLVLCDGMGGHAAGDVASSLVIGELVHLDGESHGADDVLDVLGQALEEANDRLADVMEVYPDSDGMGTTCIAMVRSGSKLAVANIGDSRAYLLRAGRLTRITKDHSFVQKLLDEGRITEDEALHHPQRSLVTRVFTGRPEDQPDLSLREVRTGDRLLLCSDGLTDYVTEETVGELLRHPDRTPGQVADSLIQTALRAGTRDNVTVVVVDVVPSGDGTTRPQVVGAASERRGTQVISPPTPAEKAAQLTREASGRAEPPDAPLLAEEQTRPWVRALRASVVSLAVLAVLGAGGWAGWTWSQQQYFVGEDEGQVTVFRGLSQDLGPLSLSTAEERTDIRVEALPAYYRDQVRRTLSADDRAGADRLVEDLRALARGACSPIVLLPDGSTTTAIPDDLALLTADSLARARALQEEEDAARDDVATTTGATAGDLAAGTADVDEIMRRALEVGLGPLAGDLGTDRAGGTAYPTPSATTDAATPTPTSPVGTAVVVWPEGCP